jgi:hypothetical protein
MDKLLSDQRLLVFLAAVMAAVGGWGIGFGTWSAMLAPKAIFGLLVILGGLLGANGAHNIWLTPPLITEVTEPKSTVTTITTTQGKGK